MAADRKEVLATLVHLPVKQQAELMAEALRLISTVENSESLRRILAKLNAIGDVSIPSPGFKS